MMVVVAIIAILAGVSFRLMSAAAGARKKAETIAKLERLQNALSGYYAVYGTYPPVPEYASRAIEGNREGWRQDAFADAKAQLNYAARTQPVTTFFPYPEAMTDHIRDYLREHQKDFITQEAHQVYGSLQSNLGKEEWPVNRLFCFGLMSFLLPRVEIIGVQVGNSRNGPRTGFYDSILWRRGNRLTMDSSITSATSQGTEELLKQLAKQRVDENEKCARWMPNLAGIVAISHPHSDNLSRPLGVNISSGKEAIGICKVDSGSQRIALQQATVRDGWGNDFFYYSAPPYQSYRLWSAGPDGVTVPPWISPKTYNTLLSKLLPADGRAVTVERLLKWVEDDIVAGAMGGQ